MGGRQMVERHRRALSRTCGSRRAGPARRRVVRAGAPAPARPRLPALPRPALRADRRTCGDARARARAAARRASGRVACSARGSAGRPDSHRLLRSSSAASRARGRSKQFIAARGARRAAHHAARRHRLAAARSLRRRATARRPHGAAGRQLGSPVEQGAAARDARSRARLERDAAARRRSSCTACPPIASSSPARSATTSGSTAHRRRATQAFCARVGLRSRPPVRALRLLVALPGHGDRAGVRASAGSRRSAAAPIRGSRTSASWSGRTRRGSTNGAASI